MEALICTGAPANDVVSLLMKVGFERDIDPFFLGFIARFIGSYGPAARSAVPFLQNLLKNKWYREFAGDEIRKALESIKPDDTQ